MARHPARQCHLYSIIRADAATNPRFTASVSDESEPDVRRQTPDARLGSDASRHNE